jgi:hypothetical protein
MHEHTRDRKIDAALGLTILGETYQHEEDELGICRICLKVINNHHGICISKVPHYSTDIKDTSKIFCKLLDKCQCIKIICEDTTNWKISFNDDSVTGTSLVEVMWKAVTKFYNLNMEEMIRIT